MVSIYFDAFEAFLNELLRLLSHKWTIHAARAAQDTGSKSCLFQSCHSLQNLHSRVVSF